MIGLGTILKLVLFVVRRLNARKVFPFARTQVAFGDVEELMDDELDQKDLLPEDTYCCPLLSIGVCSATANTSAEPEQHESEHRDDAEHGDRHTGDGSSRERSTTIDVRQGVAAVSVIRPRGMRA